MLSARALALAGTSVLTARFGRILLTALAIIASTAFLSGTFIFRDTMERTFDALFATSYENVDVYVQSSNTIETAFGFEIRDKLAYDVGRPIAAVPGVADAQAFVAGRRGGHRPRTASRSSDRRRPTSGGTINGGELSVWKVVDGRRRPENGTEVALDEQTAADAEYVIGDTVKVNAEGGSRDVHARRHRPVQRDRHAGQRARGRCSTTRRRWSSSPSPATSTPCSCSGDGTVTDERAGRPRAQAALGAGPDVSEALTGAEITDQARPRSRRGSASSRSSCRSSRFIALGVGCFVIYNVFSITAAQRRRENALLRAIGASRRQVTR